MLINDPCSDKNCSRGLMLRGIVWKVIFILSTTFFAIPSLIRNWYAVGYNHSLNLHENNMSHIRNMIIVLTNRANAAQIKKSVTSTRSIN